MKKQVIIGLTVVLGLLSAPPASQASLGRGSDMAAYQGQKKRAAKPQRQVRRARSNTRSNKGGAVSSLAGCAKKSPVGLFASTAFRPVASNANPVKAQGRKGIN